MFRRSRPVWIFILWLPMAAGAQPAVHERVFAKEDSLQVYTVPETTHVVARRIPLAEIIRKAAEGERHKYDGITTLAFNRTLKVTLKYLGHDPKSRCIENAARVYYQSPDQWAEAPLRDIKYILLPDGTRKPWNDKDEDEDIHIEMGADEGNRLSEVPDYLIDTDKYDFKILHRSLQRDQVLYEIGFKPRSEFDVLPGGRIWILTGNYQIVREEYEIANLPVPWLLKSLGLLTREWQMVGSRWVPRRITARAELRNVGLGLVDVPRTVEAVVVFDEYKFDLPLDAALFAPRSK
jgi:hypothetical protein